jgi:hypothetical protein
MQYEWRKDGIPIPGAEAAHLDLGIVDWDDEGSYEVTVTNEFGTVTSEAASLTMDVNLTRAVAVVAAGPLYGYAPLTVRFDATQSASFGPYCDVLDYGWRFGDGHGGDPPPSAPIVEHTYEHPGVYVAELVLDGVADLARVTISVTDGPYIGARDEHLFQDGFPSDGGLSPASSIRLDMAQDVGSDVGAIVPGDSIVVDIVPLHPGATLLHPSGGEGGVLYWTMVANPAFDSARAAGLSSVGATLMGADPSGWDIWSGEVPGSECYADGQVQPHRYCFDLADGPAIAPHQGYESPMFFPGDVLQYYFQAEDDAGHLTTLPADIGDFGNFEDDSPYDRRFTVRGLPTLDPYLMSQPAILVWNDAGHGDEENALLLALGNGGYRASEDYDVYTTQGPQAMASNGLGSSGAHGATPAQLDGYSCLVYTGGHLGRNLINDGSNDGQRDKSDDVGVLSAWHAGDHDRFHVYFGSNLAEDMIKTPSTIAYLYTVLGVDYLDPEVRHGIEEQIRPPVAPTAAVGGWFSTHYVADAGVPVPQGFDWVAPVVSQSLVAHEFLRRDGTPYPPGPDSFAASILWDREEAGRRKSTLMFPHSFLSVIDSQGNFDGDAKPARANLMQEILDYFGMMGGGPAVATPPHEVAHVTLEPNQPNPFNPSTEIMFETSSRGEVTVRIYDVAGKLVATLLDETMDAGRHRIAWNGKDRSGADVSSGVYIVEIRALGQRDARKMALIR